MKFRTMLTVPGTAAVMVVVPVVKIAVVIAFGIKLLMEFQVYSAGSLTWSLLLL